LVKSFTLNKNEILRGFKVFESILSESKRIDSNLFSAYFQKIDNNLNPVLKAGFIISKKKLISPAAETA
jgi:hypothetical protein